jgi:hypothetical protein
VRFASSLQSQAAQVLAVIKSLLEYPKFGRD